MNKFMQNDEKLIIGIRDSKLSKAQTNFFIHQYSQLSTNISPQDFHIQTVKTKGDIYSSHRLDRVGGKGLFIKEIEDQILTNKVHIGIHSLKDLPANDVNKGLEIVCWMKRFDAHEALISNHGKSFFDLPAGSVIGTSSIRRRSQILSHRKDLKIKLLRGNVDTRINKLKNKEYDAIILSLAGLQRLGLQNLVTEVLDFEHFLPAACQGAVGIQAIKDSNFKTTFNKLNDENTEIECKAERKVLEIIKANCNSPVSVNARQLEDLIKIDFELFDHEGNKLFKKNVSAKKNHYIELCNKLSEEVIRKVGQSTINELDYLKNDFNYAP